MLAAGKLNQRIEIMQPREPSAGPGRDPYGQTIGTEKRFAQRWASVEPLSGRELWHAQQVQSDVTHRVRLRYLPGVTPKMWLKFRGRVLEIQSVINPQEADEETHLLCVEVT